MKKKKFDVIVVGELNVDLILNGIDSFPEIGKEKLSKKMTLTLGSSSAIFASNLSSLGAKVSFIGKIGNDVFGTLVLDSLKKKGVDTSYIITSKEFNTGATIVMNYEEDRAMVTYPGAMEHLQFKNIKTSIFSQARHLHFSSYFLQPGIQTDVGKLFAKAKEIGLTTSLDLQWDPAERWEFDYKNVLPFVDVFLPNEQEILCLTKEKSVDDALNQLKDLPRIIVVKMGNHGSLMYKMGKKVFLKAFVNNNVVDAIGAGDSFNAGFIFKYIKSAKLEDCQKFGNLAGAINTTAAGGTSAFRNYSQIMKTAKEVFGYKD